MVFALLRQKLQDVDLKEGGNELDKVRRETATPYYLIAINRVVDGALQLVRGPVEGAPVVPLPGVLAPFLAVLLVRSRPAHSRLDIDAGPMLQEELDHVLVPDGREREAKERLAVRPLHLSPFETGDVQRQGAGTPVDVDVPAEAPPCHLQVVEADALLQEVVALLVVYLQNVLAPGDGG